MQNPQNQQLVPSHTPSSFSQLPRPFCAERLTLRGFWRGCIGLSFGFLLISLDSLFQLQRRDEIALKLHNNGLTDSLIRSTMYD